MYKIFTPVIFCFLFIANIVGQNFQFDSVGNKSMEIGRIVIKSDAWVIRVDHGSFYDDFWPVNLPAKYMVEGQEVVFEGALGRIPVNARLVGTPVRLRMIRNLYRAEPGGNGEKNVGEKETPVSENKDSVITIVKATGKIIMIADNYLIEQNLNGEIKRYAPDYLPEEFRVVNTEITFSGIVQKPDPNVRMMGTPLKITELSAVENIAVDKSKVQDPLKGMYPFDSVGYLATVKGVIKLVGTDPDVYLIEISAGNNSVLKYIPAILPDEFKKDKITVMVSGKIGAIPANVRLIGTPLEIDEIKLVK